MSLLAPATTTMVEEAVAGPVCSLLAGIKVTGGTVDSPPAGGAGMKVTPPVQ